MHPWTHWEALLIWARLRHWLGLLRLLGSGSSSAKGGIIKNGLTCMIHSCFCCQLRVRDWAIHLSSSSRGACWQSLKNENRSFQSPKSQAQKPNNFFPHYVLAKASPKTRGGEVSIYLWDKLQKNMSIIAIYHNLGGHELKRTVSQGCSTTSLPSDCIWIWDVQEVNLRCRCPENGAVCYSCLFILLIQCR